MEKVMLCPICEDVIDLCDNEMYWCKDCKDEFTEEECNNYCQMPNDFTRGSIINEVAQWLQDNGYDDASKALDVKYAYEISCYGNESKKNGI